MIKYSLIAVASAAVLFSVGCDDSACCSTGRVTKNVAPIITRVLGMTHNSTVSCTPGTSRTLSTTDSDVDGNLDANTYKWTVDGQPYTANSINCPADGESKQVCATVKDEKGLESNEVCVTLTGSATPVVANCKPSITMRDSSGATVTSVTAGQDYTFDNNATVANCPNSQCAWSVKSHNSIADTFFTCLINNEHTGTNDEPPVKEDGTYHVNLDGTGATASISVQTCASVYDYFIVELNCANPTTTLSQQYSLN